MNAKLSLPAFVTEFMDIFRKAGYEIYIVGGPVRDLLLGRDIHNWDFATNATPDNIVGLFDNAKYNNNFGTVIIPQNDLVFEVTPYRKEGKYSDSRHPDEVIWADTIEDDLQRRDFTINAMAYDGENLVDITNGMKDLDKKRIRAVGDPDIRFQEDALRLMRAVRFAAQLGFLVEEKTKKSIAKNAELIKNISAERIKDELLRILASDHPADGILFLKNVGILKIILPELEKAFGVEQESPERHHTDDVGTHLIKALKHCPSPDPIVRFAALLHDIGKTTTRDVDPETGVVTFYNHEIVGATQAYEIAKRLRLSKKQRTKLTKIVRYHMFSVSEEQTDKAIRRFIRKVGKEHVQDMLDVRTGDRIGSGVPESSWRTELFKKRLVEVQKKPFTVHDLKITGHDVMEVLDMKPGPQIGIVMENIFDQVADKGLENKRESLIDYLREHKDSILKKHQTEES